MKNFAITRRLLVIRTCTRYVDRLTYKIHNIDYQPILYTTHMHFKKNMHNDIHVTHQSGKSADASAKISRRSVVAGGT